MAALTFDGRACRWLGSGLPAEHQCAAERVRCAGRERSDGNDETVLDGTEEDSSFPAGFWHPYGRGNDQLPPSRVVCLSSEAIAQVTLQFPTVDAVMSAQVSASRVRTEHSWQHVC